MLPPIDAPSTTGAWSQVFAISSVNHSIVRGPLTAPLVTADRPIPGRSGAITRYRSAVIRMSGAMISAKPPCPCTSTSGGPSPPSRSEVDTPATSSRRCVTGNPSINRAASRSASLFPMFSSRVIVTSSSGRIE